jgi:integrase
MPMDQRKTPRLSGYVRTRAERRPVGPLPLVGRAQSARAAAGFRVDARGARFGPLARRSRLSLLKTRLSLRSLMLRLSTGRLRKLVDVKSRESHRTLALPAVVVRAFERERIAQAERRLAAGSQWQRSDFVSTTRTGRPYDGTLITRDLKRVAARIWIGGRTACPHSRLRARVSLGCDATQLPPLSFHGLRHSCASLLLAAGVPVRDLAELLGHSDVRLTLTSYAHVLDENRTKMASVIDRVFDTQADTQANGRG